MKLKLTLCALWIVFNWSLLPAGAEEDIRLTLGSAKVVNIQALAKVAIGNSEIADLKQISDNELLISAKTLGATTLIVWRQNGRKDIFTVVVTAGKAAQTMIQVAVQVMEISKTEDMDLGLDWEKMLGPSGQLRLQESTVPLKALGTLERGKLDLLLKLLVKKGNAKILARPKLLTLSGHKASFSSGGEIPVSTLNKDGLVNVDWKKYGVQLEILPTAGNTEAVTIEIRAEVSDVDFTHLVLGNPAIKTRWASTVVQIAPDSTVVIGGLVQERQQIRHEGLPVLSDIPILGYLFKSSRIIREESELVIFLTPQIVGQ